jgi:hypothetical protein
VARPYRRKTAWRPEEERGLYLTTEDHEPLDLDKLAEAVLVHALAADPQSVEASTVLRAVRRNKHDQHLSGSTA